MSESPEERERILRERMKPWEALLARGAITQQQFEAKKTEILGELEGVFCSSCGVPNSSSAKFCSNCGTELGAAGVAVVQARIEPTQEIRTSQVSYPATAIQAEVPRPSSAIGTRPRIVAGSLVAFLGITLLSILVPPIGYLAGLALLIMGVVSKWGVKRPRTLFSVGVLLAVPILLIAMLGLVSPLEGTTILLPVFLFGLFLSVLGAPIKLIVDKVRDRHRVPRQVSPLQLRDEQELARQVGSFCIHCGAPLDMGARFCGQCGKAAY